MGRSIGYDQIIELYFAEIINGIHRSYGIFYSNAVESKCNITERNMDIKSVIFKKITRRKRFYDFFLLFITNNDNNLESKIMLIPYDFKHKKWGKIMKTEKKDNFFLSECTLIFVIYLKKRSQ